MPPAFRLRHPFTLRRLALFYEGLTGAAAAKRLSDLSERYARVIRSTGMKVE